MVFTPNRARTSDIVEVIESDVEKAFAQMLNGSYSFRQKEFIRPLLELIDDEDHLYV